jgi:deazaflavin-dependent oxidoreductase (nitroreductase family)
MEQAVGMLSTLEDIADVQVLNLTTTERKTGLPREIEIWFVTFAGRFYLFAETGEAARWVMNIRHEPKVAVRIGDYRIEAAASVLDAQTDRSLWDQVAVIAKRKYGWGDGLPVEIMPCSAPQAISEPKPTA